MDKGGGNNGWIFFFFAMWSGPAVRVSLSGRVDRVVVSKLVEFRKANAHAGVAPTQVSLHCTLGKKFEKLALQKNDVAPLLNSDQQRSSAIRGQYSGPMLSYRLG